MAQQPTEWRRVKQGIRNLARAHRRNQPNKDRLSRQICGKLAALAEYTGAATVMFYVDAQSEVRTRHFLPTAWNHGKRIVVPYCVQGHLDLFHLEGTDELAPGAHRILEPKAELRGRADRRADLDQVDLIVVPGVAFDRRGGRLGQGKGYYDRLLRAARPDTALVALAFECQIFPQIPMQPHDVYVHKVITEEAIYEAVPSRPAEGRADSERS